MTVSDQIIQVLDVLCEKFGLVIDWTSENVLPYLTILATKLVSYEIWTSVASLVMLTAVLIVPCMLIKKHKRSLMGFDEYIFIPIGMFGTIGGAVIIAGIVTQIMDIIKCLTFPELYIFEYIQNLISTAH